MKKITEKDLANNPIKRLASCLVLDTSESMGWRMDDGSMPIDELNRGVKMYMKAIKNDEKNKEKVEIAIITFGSKEFSKSIPEQQRDPKNGVKKILDFDDHINDEKEIPSLEADGFTSMGEAVSLALEMLDERKKVYKRTSGTYDQPWLIIMTDGYPYDYQKKMRNYGFYDGETINESASKATELVDNKKLVVIPIACGDDANIDILKKFSPKNDPMRVTHLDFEKFFEYLSQTQAKPGEGFIEGATDYLSDLMNKDND